MEVFNCILMLLLHAKRRLSASLLGKYLIASLEQRNKVYNQSTEFTFARDRSQDRGIAKFRGNCTTDLEIISQATFKFFQSTTASSFCNPFITGLSFWFM